jgi:hypothetical protein
MFAVGGRVTESYCTILTLSACLTGASDFCFGAVLQLAAITARRITNGLALMSYFGILLRVIQAA